jgi:mxaJ protein
MSLVSSLIVIGSWWIAAIAGWSLATAAPPLRVCSVAESLPYSTIDHQGLDDRVAAIVAAELGRPVEHVTQPRRRAFALDAQDNAACDLIMGVPERAGRLLTTAPYYRSSYVFVTRRTLQPPVRSFDDPRLREMRIGIQLVGDEGGSAPPVRALAARGLSNQVRGFPVLSNANGAGAQRAIVDAVAAGTVDTAAVWGPIAGYFAATSAVPLAVAAIDPGPRDTQPFWFGIAIGVRSDQRALRDRVNGVLQRRSRDIARIVRAFHVPGVSPGAVAVRGVR